MRFASTFIGSFCWAASLMPGFAAALEDVMIAGVPDYDWHAGCFGTASGNLMGYWDRTGLPNLYTGPTADGIAPLDSFGANQGIRSMWASMAGFDGRPSGQPGHMDDYWLFYQSTGPDPYTVAGRPEHEPDCIGDFIGASQNKWSDLDGECSGNIDAFSFNFWDKSGNRRVNFTPPEPDIQSGWRRWAESLGYQADVFSQLADFNPEVPPGSGFTFADLRSEIDAGYPVMLFLQNPAQMSRPLSGMPRANPMVHGMVAYGYVVYDSGEVAVRYRTSWASGDFSAAVWGPQIWETQLPLRGVIGFRPLPKIMEVRRSDGGMLLKWHGPSSVIVDSVSGTSTSAHWYVIEKADAVDGPYSAITEPLSELETTLSDCCEGRAFFRVKLLTRQEAGR